MQFKAVDSIDLKRAVDIWMDSIRNDSQKHLKTIIDNIGTIRTIHNISQTFLKIGKISTFSYLKLNRFNSVDFAEKPQFWNKMLQTLQLPENLDFYGTYYQPLILQRIKTIIHLMMKKTNDEAKMEICNLMDSLDDDWTSELEL